MDCTLGVRRVALPAGSERLVLYDGDTLRSSWFQSIEIDSLIDQI